MREDVFEIAQTFLVAALTTVILYFIAITMIGGEMKPLIEELNPNNTVGIGSAQYLESSEDIWRGTKYFFYIMLSVVFLFLIVKLLYEREETSVYGGYS